MAVLVASSEQGNTFRSSTSGSIPQNEIDKAIRLDKLIQRKLKEIVSNKSVNNNKLQYYFKIGKAIKDIGKNSELYHDNEFWLYLDNVRFRLSQLDSDIPKSDFKRSRNIPYQFFRLAGYPENIVSMINWSEWSYLFDNKYLMNLEEFDSWFLPVLESGQYNFNEAFTRLWAELFNFIFKNKDVSTLKRGDFERILNFALKAVQHLSENYKINDRAERRKLRYIMINAMNGIRKSYIYFEMGKLSISELVEEFKNEFNGTYR